MSINDKFDMSVFDGTQFEGMTYLQVRRRMTPHQVKRFKALNKRDRKVGRAVEANEKLARTYIRQNQRP